MRSATALAAAFCAAVLYANAASFAPAAAKDATASILIHAGKPDNPSHALARQFAEAVAVAVNGAYALDVQESQGSVQNVIDVLRHGRNYIFTSPPDLVLAAERGDKPFTHDRRYRDIRALFPIPATTIQWVVRQDSGITSLTDLAGHSFISGTKGSIAERATATALQALGIDQAVQLLDTDAAAAPKALMSKQVSGFAIAGAYPVPSLVDLARAVPIRLLGLGKPELRKVLATDDSLAAQTLPKGIYAGVEEDVTTLAVPAGVYTTLHMRAATAYAITKAFWSQHAELVKRNPPWQAVTASWLATLRVKLHKGALRYYDEAKIKVPAALR